MNPAKPVSTSMLPSLLFRKIAIARTLARILTCACVALAGLAPVRAAAASAASASAATASATAVSGVQNIRDHGARGDGRTLDSPAINRAIDAAAAAGGGTVFFPSGTYLSVSIHLRSNVALHLGAGAVILAASPAEGFRYDPPEPNENDQWQDFGHTHFQNSLIWGENLENISITGPGLINGAGLVRSGAQSRGKNEGKNAVLKNAPVAGRAPGKFGYPNAADAVEPGWGNKAIALKLCRNVTIRDISILRGGHFCILATGVDNLTVDNVTMDTNRDGIDLDGCRQARVSNCAVNSPNDDGICLKSSYPLGRLLPCENITITNCQVSGFLDGTLLDGTRVREGVRDPTGRIKFGTESNGAFRNIAITNCVFEHCRGLALETVDGAQLEDVVISNITMRDIVNAPIYLRLGARLRGPAETTKPGALRRVKIDNIVAHNVTAKQGILIAGLPDEKSAEGKGGEGKSAEGKGAERKGREGKGGERKGMIEDVTLSHIFMDFEGGGTEKQAAREMPELETDYPDPARHGDTPAWALFARHAKNLALDHVEFRAAKPDARPAIVLDDVTGATLDRVKLPAPAAAAPAGADADIVLRNGATLAP